MSLIDSQRYWDQLLTLGTITDPNQPYTRRSFSDLFIQGRAWLTEQMQAVGLTVHVDAAGNLIGRKAGKRPELGCIMLGSHSDSVPSGGRFDGIAGVIAALECAQSLHTHGIELNHDLEIVDFLAEEPSEWGISCVGSRGLSGFLSPELLQSTHPKTEETLAAAITRMGGNPSQLTVRNNIAAFMELHIEQGLVLEQKQIAIGVVTGIVGIIRLSITFDGQAAHAGTTPMSLRQDTLAASAHTISQAQLLATQMSALGQGYFVATCGQIHNHPNASNVVPGRTQVVFDIRSSNRDLMIEFVEKMNEIATAQAQIAHVRVTQFERLTDTYPVNCDEALMQHIETACHSLGHTQQRMPSGAGHDAAFLGQIAPSAMVFVPSVAGKSHCPEEWTNEPDLSAGVAVLMQALMNVDQAAKPSI